MAGCGGSTGSNAGSSPATSALSEAAQLASATTKSDVTLKLTHWKVAFDPSFKAVAEAFKNMTGITVETEAITPDDTYQQKLKAQASTDTLPDIYMYWAGAASGAYDGKAMDWSDELH